MSDNAISVVLDDAEKIAEELCPPVAAVPRVVGVLIKQVEQLAQSQTGKGIEQLAEAALGITPAEGAEDVSELKAEVEQLKAQLEGKAPAETPQQEIARLQAEKAELEAAAADKGKS